MEIPFLKRLRQLTGPRLPTIVAGSGPAAAPAAALLARVLAELPDLLAAAVIDPADGHLLASYAVSAEYQLPRLAAHQAEVARQVQHLLRALELPPEEQLQEVLLTLPRQEHLLRRLPDGRLLFLAVDCRDTNLALAREVLRACEA